jgi:hypothetical protein
MTSFELACACGQPLRGERQRRHQVVPCPACGRSSFVFPLSPYDLPAEVTAKPSGVWRRSWRTPLFAALGSVSILLVGFVLAWPYLMRRTPAVEEQDAGKLLAEGEAGRVALSKGKFHLGRRLLEGALARRDRHPTLLTAEQSHDLNQLHRQADLLARLSNRSLEEIVRQGMLVRDPEEWAAQFADYRGRTIVFDDLFRRDADGRPVPATDVVEVGQEVIRLAIEEVELLQDLPLNDSPRLIFGARLAGCRREEGGAWVIRFEPDSGVLLTDPDSWQACASADLDDDTRRVFARQRQWLEQHSLVGPARSGR